VLGALLWILVKPELQVGILNSDYVKPDFPALGELELKPFNGHIKTAEQRTITQQYSDWYTGS